MISTTRTFIALELPAELKRAIADYVAPLRKLGGRVSWVKEENVHLTIKFLGETPNHKLDRITEALRERCKNFESISVELSGAGVFPNERQPRVLWIGVNDPKERLAVFAKDIDSKLHKLGFQKEKRRFSAHLTVGRVKEGNVSAIINEIRANPFPPYAMTFQECTFMKSQLHSKGSIYTPIQKIEFGQTS